MIIGRSSGNEDRRLRRCSVRRSANRDRRNLLLNVQGGISNFAKNPAPLILSSLLWLNVWYALGVVGKFVLAVSPAIYALPA